MMLPSSPSIRRSASLALFGALAIPAVAASARAQDRTNADTTRWSGRVPTGHWIRVRNINGPITVTSSTGDQVEVVAVKRWRRGDPSYVRIQTTKVGPNGDDVLVCALWGPDATCSEHGYDSGDNNGDHGMHRNDVSVEFRVQLPKGVKVAVSSVNGPVRVDSATSEVNAGTVNGEVDVSTSGGPVNASTVNGSVRASVGHVDTDGSMRFNTVNGRIVVELPADVGADIDLSTLTGSLHSDYEMTVSGHLDPRRIHAHIGKPGGPRIRISTINGSVELRKRP